MQELKKVIDKIEQMFYSIPEQNICSVEKEMSHGERGQIKSTGCGDQPD